MNAIFSFYLFLSPVLSLTEYYEGSYSKVNKEKILPITYRLKIIFSKNNSSHEFVSIKAIFSYIEQPTSSIPDEPFLASGTYVKSADIFFMFFTREPFVQIEKSSLSYQEKIGKYISQHPNLTQEQQIQYHKKFKEFLRNQTTPKSYVTYVFRRNCSNITNTCYLLGTQSNQYSKLLLYTSMRTYDNFKLDRDWRLFVSLFGLVITLKTFIWLVIPKTQPSLVCSALIQYYCMGDMAISLLFSSERKYFDTLNTTVFTVILIFSLFITFYHGISMINKSEMIESQTASMQWIRYLSNFRFFYFFNVYALFKDFPAISLFLAFSFMIPQIVFSAIYNKKKTIGLMFIFSLVFTQFCSVYLIIEYTPNKDYYFPRKNTMDYIKLPAIWASLQLIFIVLQRIFGGAFFVPPKSRSVQFSYTAEKPPPDSECEICLCNIGDEEEYYSTPCHHYFHKECLARWMEENTICPICRTPLPIIEE